MVIYVCFFKGATEDMIPKMGMALFNRWILVLLWHKLEEADWILSCLLVTTLLNMKLCETDSGKYTSVLELPGSVLIVPQATLGGKPKGRGMQYHGNIGKEDGQKLYASFVFHCEKELSLAVKCNEAGTEVRHGTYGNRQVLKLDTNGPYTHLMEFWELSVSVSSWWTSGIYLIPVVCSFLCFICLLCQLHVKWKILCITDFSSNILF